MRQIGILSAAGIMALENGAKRIADDHDNARALAAGLSELSGISLDLDRVVTNIIIFDIAGTGRSSAEIVAALNDQGILAIGFGSLIRMVTHLDVSADDISRTLQAME